MSRLAAKPASSIILPIAPAAAPIPARPFGAGLEKQPAYCVVPAMIIGAPAQSPGGGSVSVRIDRAVRVRTVTDSTPSVAILAGGRFASAAGLAATTAATASMYAGIV